MKKELISLKKIIILAGALCAYWIGAGFATGQEVLQFFTTSGANGIIAAVIFLALMSGLTYILYGIGQKKKFGNPYDVFEYYCGKVIGQVYIWYTVVLVYAIFVVMLAGAGATINQYYGIPTYVGTGVIALLSLGTVVLGVEKLIEIIGVIGPIKIIFVAIVGVSGIATLINQPNLLSEASNLIPTLGFQTASSNWAWSGILYAFLALMVSIPFQVDCGASAKSLKEARTAGLIGTIAFTVAIISLVIAELVYYKLIVGQQVPTLAIANHISPVLGLIFSVLIVLSIYSAVASFLLVTVRKFAVDKTKKFNTIAIILTAIGMIFGGILPFDKLVNILYPLAGYSAIIFTCFIIYKELRVKNRKFDNEVEVDIN
ncbi:YkvI family membrane protein [Clostridium cibarium]|uniref:Uncharacterized protein n=1 Tax=Clostridium cibarium TaxID=2762247 RepID=A0ABR8PVQ0_9CLOT|nr:hypothetical protein [Clostridium cibarium]MBD7912244.1 hypothetical protein [Clostridium cibarium]